MLLTLLQLYGELLAQAKGASHTRTHKHLHTHTHTYTHTHTHIHAHTNTQTDTQKQDIVSKCILCGYWANTSQRRLS